MIYGFDPVLDTKRLLKPVCKMFQLSPAEGKLACLLAANHPMTKAADVLRIKEQAGAI